MIKPIPTSSRDSKGRLLWQKFCTGCGKSSIVRFEGIYKLCRSCAKAQGKGFPPGTLIDPEFEHLKRFSWNINNSGYIKGPGGELHRIVMNAKKGQEVHHLNHNKLDCRKSNLVFTTHSKNLLASWDLRKNRKRVTDVNFF
jgi:hypothetical protein